jgi:hypothetical protein
LHCPDKMHLDWQVLGTIFSETIPYLMIYSPKL